MVRMHEQLQPNIEIVEHGVVQSIIQCHVNSYNEISRISALDKLRLSTWISGYGVTHNEYLRTSKFPAVLRYFY
jgi:hypothetical protein